MCKILRRDPATAGIPVIMLTAKAAEIDRILGLELGADDYLAKPFSPRELLARLKAVLRRAQPGVLAHVFEYLRVAHMNVQETENIIFDGAQAAVARINLDGAPSARALDAMRSSNADILDLQLVKLA